ncbi:hypothetical protein KFK09_010390 [Dendrobium nobile]|uniref:Uncharacterized protein n=1 Tax=Dendrobium nobile TaxID=94219 RepID=A0A8T3BBK9_DENNO|nr:hypothetical protein KFK09_010390 [Dendrobium nobile]
MKVDNHIAASSMRKLCPNLDREDGLDTVLEVPIPEEMFVGGVNGRNSSSKHLGTRCTNVMAWMRSQVDHRSASSVLGRNAELQLMLGVVGAPLVPIPMPSTSHHSNLTCGIKEDPIEASMAKYIVQQYIAAAGGEKALNAISSMYAMGKVRMAASELRPGAGGNSNGGGKKAGKGAGGGCSGEMGGFVLWQKRPDLWCLELVVSGCKISAGSNGKIAWRQTPWQQSHASRGPPRPLRRSLQGMDPKSTANLFTSAVCIGEKTINNHDCFVLRLDAEASTLRSRSSSSVEIIRHTLWGYFSQRTALLVHLEDSHLLRIKTPNQESVYWETTMESSINDYRPVDGVQIAHAGRTSVSLFRFGETEEGNTRTRMEETWTVEEVDFNIWGLSMDCFLPPGDIKEEKEGIDEAHARMTGGRTAQAGGNLRIGASQIAAVNIDETME